MVWYRGVDCKDCKAKIGLKRLSRPDEGPLDPGGSQGWMGTEIICPTCRESNFYWRPDFMVFETLEPMAGDPTAAEKNKGKKPN